MIYLIAGTNRPQSKTLEVAKIIEKNYSKLSTPVELIALENVNLAEQGGKYNQELYPDLKKTILKLNKADGIHFVIPEYNGGMPGYLKYFIDFFTYPDTFEWRPVCFTGLGGRWGGLRPVEQAQAIFGYRNAYSYPVRIFIQNVPKIVFDGKIHDPELEKLLVQQSEGFVKFIRALRSEKLDANSIAKI